jgi:hypothetical protein
MNTDDHDASINLMPEVQKINAAIGRAKAKADTGKTAKVAPGFYVLVTRGTVHYITHTTLDDGVSYWEVETDVRRSQWAYNTKRDAVQSVMHGTHPRR